MLSLTQLKSDCCNALEQCIRDCQKMVNQFKDVRGMEKCVELGQICIGACAECLDACESAKLNRGKQMFICLEVCKECANECEKFQSEECVNCAASCRNCIVELSHAMA